MSTGETTTRRGFMKTAATALGALPLATWAQTPAGDGRRPLSVVCVGAHPDDPESCCGGTLRKFSDAGHRVTVVYLTRGEAGIEGKSHAEAAAIRTEEARAACKILKVESRFFGQIDGTAVLDRAAVSAMERLLAELQPDLVFTHWPIDTHHDHLVTSGLMIQARLRAARPFEVYFFEAFTGEQSMGFRPTDYVDITAVHAVKREAIFCHASQGPAVEFYTAERKGRQDAIDRWRGIESGAQAAEAFVRLTARGAGGLI